MSWCRCRCTAAARRARVQPGARSSRGIWACLAGTCCGARGARRRRPICRPRSATQRARRVRAAARGASVGGRSACCSWTMSRHRCDAGGVRAGAAGGRGARRARAYRGASRVATALTTSAATSPAGDRRRDGSHAIGRRRLPPIALAHARQQGEVALVAVAARRLPRARAVSGAMSSRMVRSGGGRKRWISREPGRIEAVRFAVGDARRDVAVADDRHARRRARGRSPACCSWRLAT